MAELSELWKAILPWAWEKRHEIARSLTDLYRWFRGETKTDPTQRGILIIGPGGVGKTTLARILSGEFNWLLDELWKYDESFGIEQYSLKDDPNTRIAVPPGQTARRESSWSDVQANIAKGLYRGIILVGSNGFHSIGGRASYKNHPLYRGNKEQFLEALIEACCKDEFGILKRLIPFVKSCSTKIWIFSIITKEDLWHARRADVITQFIDGEFAQEMGALATHKGASSFRFEHVLTSLVIVTSYRVLANHSEKTPKATITSNLSSQYDGCLKF